MFKSLPPGVRRALLRLGEVLLTFAAFAACNAFATRFEIDAGVSILFPATAVVILCCVYFGPWAVIGIVAGTIVTPWMPTTTTTLIVSGLVSSAEGLIPWAVFRFGKHLYRDLRDIRSLLTFLVFGTILNTAFCAIAGNMLVVAHPAGVFIEPQQVFVWWLADFTAALLLATPAMAFGGALRRDDSRAPRTLRNALQIVVIVILLGWGTAFAIRTYLLQTLESDRFAQQSAWMTAEETVSEMHESVLRHDRAATERAIAQVTALLSASPDLHAQFAAVVAATRQQPQAPETSRAIHDLRTSMEKLNIRAWSAFVAKRRKMMLVASIVDALVFVILLLASATLLLNVSRPFDRLRNEIGHMRESGRFDAANIDSRYVEFRSLAGTLEDASLALQGREEELRLQTERAVRASKAKSDFLAKMSHELRTPLNSIIGFTELLREQESIPREKRVAFLDNVATSAHHLLGLINDLLDISKVESGKMSLRIEDVDLRASIANTVASTAPLFVRKKQKVDVALPDEPMMVRADRARMEQVLLNLLSNANKFSPEGGRIEVVTSSEAERVRIEVRDRGIGISACDQQRIFEEFEQVHPTGTLSNGTGLGLALAKRFVEAHGGEIAVESAAGEGAVFSVILPR